MELVAFIVWKNVCNRNRFVHTYGYSYASKLANTILSNFELNDWDNERIDVNVMEPITLMVVR